MKIFLHYASLFRTSDRSVPKKINTFFSTICIFFWKFSALYRGHISIWSQISLHHPEHSDSQKYFKTNLKRTCSLTSDGMGYRKSDFRVPQNLNLPKNGFIRQVKQARSSFLANCFFIYFKMMRLKKPIFWWHFQNPKVETDTGFALDTPDPYSIVLLTKY